MSEIRAIRRLSTREVMQILNVSRATLFRWQRDGLMPKRRRIGGSVGWLESEITTLLESGPLVQ